MGGLPSCMYKKRINSGRRAVKKQSKTNKNPARVNGTIYEVLVCFCFSCSLYILLLNSSRCFVWIVFFFYYPVMASLGSSPTLPLATI